MDYKYNRKLAIACGLITIPCRRTFDRRLKTISTIDIKERISTIGNLFVTGHLVRVDDHSITAKDSIWH